MKKLLATTGLVLSLTCFPIQGTLAQGIPVIDTSQIAQVIATLQQQIKDYEQQINQLTTLKDQFTNMQQRLQAMTGAKGISSILNGAGDKAARKAATDLKSIVDGAISGTVIAGNVGDMNSVISDLKSRFSLGGLSTFNSSDIASNKAIASLAGSGLAAVATADDSYKRANSAVTRVTALVDQIDSTTDLKASVDFNTRVNVEVAFLILELIRVQSAQTNAAGMQALHRARDGQASRNFMKTGDN
ncbi:MAG: type IV secretion system protein [Rhodothermales bacterium]